jgi:hypothetical protein
MAGPSPYYGSNYIVLNSGGTAAILADGVYDPTQGITTYVQYFKASFGVSGAYTPVTSSSPLPVTIATGLTATVSGFTGTITIQGTPSGTAVPVSGSVVVSGITSAPVYVQTAPNCRVEITGGQRLNKSTDSISVFGPSGNTWIYANLVNASGNAIGTTSNPMQVSFSGVTITTNLSATIGVTNDSAGNGLRIQGMTGGLSVAVTVGNTVGINDTAILASMAGISNQLGTLNSQILSIAGVVPTGITAGRITATTAYGQLDAGGYTCSNGVNVKSSTSNTDIIYLNSSGISASGIGYELDPGQAFFIKVNNTNKVYIKAKSGSQIISFLAS